MFEFQKTPKRLYKASLALFLVVCVVGVVSFSWMDELSRPDGVPSDAVRMSFFPKRNMTVWSYCRESGFGSVHTQYVKHEKVWTNNTVVYGVSCDGSISDVAAPAIVLFMSLKNQSMTRLEVISPVPDEWMPSSQIFGRVGVSGYFFPVDSTPCDEEVLSEVNRHFVPPDGAMWEEVELCISYDGAKMLPPRTPK